MFVDGGPRANLGAGVCSFGGVVSGAGRLLKVTVDGLGVCVPVLVVT